MKFDCVVGNPPYGVGKKGTSPFLHLNVMENSVNVCGGKLVFVMPGKPIVKRIGEKWYRVFREAVCTDIIPLCTETFSGTHMDSTAIYVIDRNAPKESYCRRLDVEDTIYNMIEDEGHRLFLEKIGGRGFIEVIQYKQYFRNEGERESHFEKLGESLKEGYYLNISKTMSYLGTYETKWFSEKLDRIGVLDKDGEISFLKYDPGRKMIIYSESREYCENLKKLMKNLVLRYSLWICAWGREIFQEDLKYVPDLDYSVVDTDKKILEAVGLTPEEIEIVMEYLRDFDFSQNRNDLVRNYNF